MSSVYATEPSPSGRIIFETTHGPLDMELWCRECPATTRLILQLALDGFYQNQVFHRILPNTLIQTGAGIIKEDSTTASSSIIDWTTTATTSKASNYCHRLLKMAWERRRYELNSRLRFRHRGMVAAALPLDETDDNNYTTARSLQPQFFISLDETTYLDGKHVIFGRISGPTIFNAIRIGRTGETATDNAAAHDWKETPRIVQVKIMENPFPADLLPTPPSDIPWRTFIIKDNDPEKKKKKKNRTGKYDLNVLSFGDELGKEDFTGKAKDRSETRKNTKESPAAAAAADLSEPPTERQEEILQQHLAEYLPDINGDHNNQEDSMTSRPERPEEIVPYPKGEEYRHDYNHGDNINNNDNSIQSAPTPPAAGEQPQPPPNNKLAEIPIVTQTTHKAKSKTKLNGASLLQEMRNRAQFASASSRSKRRKSPNHHHGGGGGINNNNNTMSKLLAFQSRLQQGGAATARQPTSSTESYHGQVLEDDDHDDDYQKNGDWMNTRFKCRKHMDLEHLVGGDGRRIEEYQVVDDRQSKDNNNNHANKKPKQQK